MGTTSSELGRRELNRRFLPFVAVATLGLASAAVPPTPSNWPVFGVAVALTGAIAAVGLLAPWQRLPRWTYLGPSLSYFAVVALLREALGGPHSGYSTLALLPIVWVALTLGRREVGISVLAGALVHLGPVVLVGPPEYPSSEWRRAIIWVATSTLVGFAVNALVVHARRQAATASERADALARSEATISAVMRVTRALGGSGEVRRHAAEAARELAGASFAVVAEPTRGRLQVTAASGFSGGVPEISQHGGCALAFASCRRIVVSDAATSDLVSPALRTATGARACVFEPIVRSGRATGVFVVGWGIPLDELPTSVSHALELLAAEVATAIERDDLIARLEQTSRTDELTGLPNRRRWEEELPRALDRSRRTDEPLSIVMMDLDRFKSYNDRHGHQAGDELLREAGEAWRHVLRPDDVLARYGGEEFAALLVGSSLEDACHVADRLRRATPGGQTCSAGVATWDGRERAVDAVRRADMALYAAKSLGRNRTEASAAEGVGTSADAA